MEIGAASFEPYIYNTNTLSGSSLSKISAVPDDLLTSQTDFSGLTEEDLNENPLRKGETSNFADVLQMQLQMGRLNASRLIKEAEGFGQAFADSPMQETQGLEESQINGTAAEDVKELSETEIAVQSTLPAPENVMDGAEAMQDFMPAEQTSGSRALQVDFNLYQMQRASQAYQANMIA